MKRIQRRRTRGWRMPPDAIYVGRPSRWGNPYTDGDHDRRLVMFRAYAAAWLKSKTGLSWVAPLRNHDLVCWCPLDQPCHADVLLELVAGPGEAAE